MYIIINYIVLNYISPPLWETSQKKLELNTINLRKPKLVLNIVYRIDNTSENRMTIQKRTAFNQKYPMKCDHKKVKKKIMSAKNTTMVLIW